MRPPAETLWDVIDRLRERHDCYPREAYAFVVSALGFAVSRLPVDRREDPTRRHLHGREVIEGVIDLARAEFGPLASAVFGEWRLRRGHDVGAIVFQLVDAGQLSTQPDDCIEDFDEPVDLRAAVAADREARSGSRDSV